MSDISRRRIARDNTTSASTPRAARLLGFAGLAPFACFLLGSIAASGDLANLSRDALIAYGAIILSFMGGCRWGFAAVDQDRTANWRRYTVAVLPALYALPMTLIEFRAGALGLGVGLVALYLADLRLTRNGGAPVWWPKLRLPLTCGATVCLVVAALA